MERDEDAIELDGSGAALYCLERAYRQGIIDLTDPAALSNLGIEQVSEVLRSDNGTQISMLKERVQCLNELWQGVQEWSGQDDPGWEESAVEFDHSLARH